MAHVARPERKAAAWAEANPAGLVDGPPAEVVAGEVRLMAAASPAVRPARAPQRGRERPRTGARRGMFTVTAPVRAQISVTAARGIAVDGQPPRRASTPRRS